MPLPRLLLLSLLTLGLGVGAQAGTEIGHPIPVGKLLSFNGSRIQLSGKVVGYRWLGRSGPGPMTGPARLVAPPGEWTDVELVFEGPVRLRGFDEAGEFISIELDLPQITVALEEPATGGEALTLDLALPAGAAALSDAALARAIEDGAIARVRRP